jgi:MinD-like ATPase involved in chromosome partitioning or flagellar assembly
MTTAETTPGQIITFYSFKGGVGRSMALANIAFLAALNGLKVLVMDWDLEAPGLHHYFKGLRIPDKFNKLKDRPGILDIAWHWQAQMEKAETEEEIEALIQLYRQGDHFQNCISTLLPPDKGLLDFIGAGSNSISTPEPVSYEQALAGLSWPDFFEAHAGGHAIAALRDWAKQHYDLVLLDSRTGMADVAGICTMQMPDSVVLCFALNVQNIEGIAEVAAAISTNRQDQIRLRAMPMRVPQIPSSEKDKALSYAEFKLLAATTLTETDLKKDFEQLTIYQTENTYFFEALSAFMAVTPHLDPLTLNYAQATEALTNQEIKPLKLDAQWIAKAKLWMTAINPSFDQEYLTKLMTSRSPEGNKELLHRLELLLDAAPSKQDNIDQNKFMEINSAIENLNNFLALQKLK